MDNKIILKSVPISLITLASVLSFWRYSILLLFAVVCFNSVSAQNCNNTENSCSTPHEKKFTKSAISRSIKIRHKQRKTFNVNMFEGKEYYISVCGKSKLGNIQLRILSAENKLIYDNAAAGLIDFIIIKSELTQKLIIEVSAPTGNFSGKDA